MRCCLFFGITTLILSFIILYDMLKGVGDEETRRNM